MLTVIPMVTKKEIAREYTQKEKRKEFNHLTVKNQLNTKNDGNQEMRDKNLSATCKTDNKMIEVSHSLSVIKVSHQKTNSGRLDNKTKIYNILPKDTQLGAKDTYRLKVRRWEKIFYA